MDEIHLTSMDSIRWPNRCFLCGRAGPEKTRLLKVPRSREVGVPVCTEDFHKLRRADRISSGATVAIVLAFILLGVGSFWIDLPPAARVGIWFGGALASLVLETGMMLLVQDKVIGADLSHGLPIISFDRKTRRYRILFYNEQDAAAMRRINIDRSETGYSTDKGYPVLDVGMGMPLGARAHVAKGKIEILGSSYELAVNLDQCCALLTSGSPCAMPLDNLKYSEVMDGLQGCLPPLESKPARKVPPPVSMRLVCVGCSWEIPEIYRQSLTASATGSPEASRAAIGYGEFGTAGKCPRCGSTSSYLILEPAHGTAAGKKGTA
jgi:hypothetical protein